MGNVQTVACNCEFIRDGCLSFVSVLVFFMLTLYLVVW